MNIIFRYKLNENTVNQKPMNEHVHASPSLPNLPISLPHVQCPKHRNCELPKIWVNQPTNQPAIDGGKPSKMSTSTTTSDQVSNYTDHIRMGFPVPHALLRLKRPKVPSPLIQHVRGLASGWPAGLWGASPSGRAMGWASEWLPTAFLQIVITGLDVAWRLKSSLLPLKLIASPGFNRRPQVCQWRSHIMDDGTSAQICRGYGSSGSAWSLIPMVLDDHGWQWTLNVNYIVGEGGQCLRQPQISSDK